MNQHRTLRSLILAALLGALTAIGAWLQIPVGITSITLQFLFTAFAGVLLGWKWGAVSQLLYVAIGLLGLPVFTQGGGIGYVLQPSFGFLLGLIPGAAIIGALMVLTPGVALTMGVRDILNGDYLSGSIRLLDALLIAGSIAGGVVLGWIMARGLGVA